MQILILIITAFLFLLIGMYLEQYRWKQNAKTYQVFDSGHKVVSAEWYGAEAYFKHLPMHAYMIWLDKKVSEEKTD